MKQNNKKIKAGDLVRWSKESGIPGVGLVLLVYWPPDDFNGGSLYVEVMWVNGNTWSCASAMLEVVNHCNNL